jgi:hypothetical protein
MFLTVSADKCTYLEIAKDYKGKSKPLFLLYRNGQLKAKIEGTNTPLLSTQIRRILFTSLSKSVKESPGEGWLRTPRGQQRKNKAWVLYKINHAHLLA